MNLNFTGVIIAVCSFFIIGVFHPIVIKCEYHFSKKIWPLFLIFGILFCTASLFVQNEILAPLLGITGCSCVWSIKEILEQEKRVEKGWFPKKGD